MAVPVVVLRKAALVGEVPQMYGHPQVHRPTDSSWPAPAAAQGRVRLK
jgi:hypothetical protein